MIPRTSQKALLRMAKGFPIIALTGPRQSSKTTLAKLLGEFTLADLERVYAENVHIVNCIDNLFHPL